VGPVRLGREGRLGRGLAAQSRIANTTIMLIEFH
jgi:hypothetical protein